MTESPTSQPLDPDSRLLRDVEAVLFAAGRPLDLETIVSACSHAEPIFQASVAEVLAQLERLYPVDGAHGFELARVAEGWMFRTNAYTAPALERLFDVTEDLRLSPAAMETLAIVAYLQPVSRPEISDVRGVNSDTALHTLVDRDLVQETGRRDAPGSAILYGTTSRFLVAFGLESLSSLPPIEQFEVGEEQREELKRRLGLVVAPG
jgi:segregation and condensation protein B